MTPKSERNEDNKNKKTKLTALNFVFRDFQPSDEEDCAHLDRRANQHKNPKLEKIPILKQLLDSIQVYPSHPVGFDGKAKLLAPQEYELIVCEDTAAIPKPRVVAMILCHITRVSGCRSSHDNDDDDDDDNSVARKVGWVYGLRVDQSYQRRGLGSALQHELERRCASRHVDMLYLTVNNDNEKAKNLYQALSYQHASHRSTSTKFLLSVSDKKRKDYDDDGDTITFRLTQHVNAAAAITAMQYKDCDLCPIPVTSDTPSSFSSVRDGFIQLLETPNEMYEGTFLAVKRSELPEACLKHLLAAENATNQNHGTDNDEADDLIWQKLHTALATAIQQEELPNYGAISLWNSSAVKGFQVDRVVFTKETWLAPWFQWLLWTSVVVILAWWGKRVATSFLTLTTSWTVLWTLVWVLEFMLLGFVTLSTRKAHKYFRFLVTRDSRRLQSRAFAPCHFGKEGMDCLRAAVQASQVHGKKQGFALWVLNVDKDHPYANKFGKGFSTQFWQKWLVNKATITDDFDGIQQDGEQGANGNAYLTSNTWKPFSATAFCDPRHF